MGLHDLQVSRGGMLQTDLVTGSKRRVVDRAIEIMDRGEQCRVLDSTGAILGPENFVHDYRAKGRVGRTRNRRKRNR
jgi:hypothetical protein